MLCLSAGLTFFLHCRKCLLFIVGNVYWTGQLFSPKNLQGSQQKWHKPSFWLGSGCWWGMEPIPPGWLHAPVCSSAGSVACRDPPSSCSSVKVLSSLSSRSLLILFKIEISHTIPQMADSKKVMTQSRGIRGAATCRYACSQEMMCVHSLKSCWMATILLSQLKAMLCSSRTWGLKDHLQCRSDCLSENGKSHEVGTDARSGGQEGSSVVWIHETGLSPELIH